MASPQVICKCSHCNGTGKINSPKLTPKLSYMFEYEGDIFVLGRRSRDEWVWISIYKPSTYWSDLTDKSFTSIEAAINEAGMEAAVLAFTSSKDMMNHIIVSKG